MAQLTYPIVAFEMLADVRVNLHAPALASLQAANLPGPSSVLAKAILDTGSNVSGLSTAIIQQLSLRHSSQSKTHGIGGLVPVLLFRISLSIFDAAQPRLPWFEHPDLWVMELPSGIPVDVLIGMDVLLGCRTLIDGPSQSFTIDF